jgi:hypothetical protein
MIPNYQKVDATFKADGEPYAHRPVVAWTDDGDALIANGRAGDLKIASSFGNFQWLSSGEGTDRDDEVVAVLPGNGWVVNWKEEEADPDPVFAWLVTRGGYIKPVVMGADGYAEDPRQDKEFKSVERQ